MTTRKHTQTHVSGTPKILIQNPLYQAVSHTPDTRPDLHKHTPQQPVSETTPDTALPNYVSAGQRLYHLVSPTGRVGLRHHTHLHPPAQGTPQHHLGGTR